MGFNARAAGFVVRLASVLQGDRYKVPLDEAEVRGREVNLK